MNGRYNENEQWTMETYPITEDLKKLGLSDEDARRIEKRKLEYYAHILFLELHSLEKDDRCKIIPIKLDPVREGTDHFPDEVYKKIGEIIKESVKKVITDSRNLHLLDFQKKILKNYIRIFEIPILLDKETIELYKKELKIINRVEDCFKNNEIAKALDIFYSGLLQIKREKNYEKYCEYVQRSYEKFFYFRKSLNEIKKQITQIIISYEENLNSEESRTSIFNRLKSAYLRYLKRLKNDR